MASRAVKTGPRHGDAADADLPVPGPNPPVPDQQMLHLIPVRDQQVEVPQVVSQQEAMELPKRDAVVVAADPEAREILLLLPAVSDRALAFSETGSDLNHP